VGTDIHLFVESREREGAPWQLAHPEWVCTHCDGARVGYDGLTQCAECGGIGRVTRWNARNVAMFQMLGDVDLSGDGDGIHLVPIAQPRGWPRDLSEGLKTVMRVFLEHDEPEDETPPLPLGRMPEWPGDENPSWFLLSEIIDHVARLSPQDREHLGEDFTVRYLSACQAMATHPQDVRLLFNFDS
jgi:hypothetical protein